jgi:hypothetical protein
MATTFSWLGWRRDLISPIFLADNELETNGRLDPGRFREWCSVVVDSTVCVTQHERLTGSTLRTLVLRRPGTNSVLIAVASRPLKIFPSVTTSEIRKCHLENLGASFLLIAMYFMAANRQWGL